MPPRPGTKSFILLALQLGCIAFILLTGPLFACGWLLLIEIAGVALGAWAVLVMRVGHFNIFPDVLETSTLVTRGPYSFIRHPMYTAIILICAPLVISVPNIVRWCVMIILTIDLILKLSYEETLLSKRFTEYGEYSKRTKGLLPWVF